MNADEEDEKHTLAKAVVSLKLERDGYKNSCAALTARVAELEAGGPDARVNELSAELGRMRCLIEAQQAQITQAALQQKEILKILGHGECDGLDHTYDWDY